MLLFHYVYLLFSSERLSTETSYMEVQMYKQNWKANTKDLSIQEIVEKFSILTRKQTEVWVCIFINIRYICEEIVRGLTSEQVLKQITCNSDQ